MDGGCEPCSRVVRDFRIRGQDREVAAIGLRSWVVLVWDGFDTVFVPLLFAIAALFPLPVELYRAFCLLPHAVHYPFIVMPIACLPSRPCACVPAAHCHACPFIAHCAHLACEPHGHCATAMPHSAVVVLPVATLCLGVLPLLPACALPVAAPPATPPACPCYCCLHSMPLPPCLPAQEGWVQCLAVPGAQQTLCCRAVAPCLAVPAQAGGCGACPYLFWCHAVVPLCVLWYCPCTVGIG
ncbi:hypothetical protein NPIL_479431 [Nephila pilipes]|uniref:Uncharacterized protein n=1 Tax=Nephila pilipes TaxID=299642 RepID=A0A8X6IDV0_NEPPI|nr:hypothetical protein NPIL_479431 [Nephila pilipes]